MTVRHAKANSHSIDMLETWATSRHDDDIVAIRARLRQRRFNGKPVAFFGSSSFRNWHCMAEDLNSTNVVNLGFGGGTIESALHYFDVLFETIDPKAVVLYFGENDIANDGQCTETIVSRFVTLQTRIRSALGELPTFYVSAKHSPARWIYKDIIDDLNQTIKAICEEDATCIYLDCTTCLLGENGRPMERYYLPDKIHLNSEGYFVWANVMRRVPGLGFDR